MQGMIYVMQPHPHAGIQTTLFYLASPFGWEIEQQSFILPSTNCFLVLAGLSRSRMTED